MIKLIKFIFLIIFSFYLLFFQTAGAIEKIKVGLLVPMSGENKDLGQLIIKSTRMALQDINTNKIEIYPKDTGSDPNKTLESTIALKKIGVKIIIGPIFF